MKWKCDACEDPGGPCIFDGGRTLVDATGGCPLNSLNTPIWEAFGVPDMPNPPEPPPKKTAWCEYTCRDCGKREWVRFVGNSKIEILPPPRMGRQFAIGTMFEKCMGCQAFYEVTAECSLPDRCLQPGEHPFHGEIPIAKVVCESGETRALVTADECLRVIAECNDCLRHEYELHAVGAKQKMPDKCRAALYDTIKMAAKNLQIQLQFSVAMVKDEESVS